MFSVLFSAVFALLLAACGGGSTTEAGDGTEGPAVPSAEETAEENQSELESSDDARDIEVLAVADGSVSTIRAAVDGDRPVLLWFYAPH